MLAPRAYLNRMGWHLCFDEPIPLARGTDISSLQDAIAFLARSISKTDHRMKEIHAAAHCVTLAVENGGPVPFARIGMMQAINRHRPRYSIHDGKSRIGDGASSTPDEVLSMRVKSIVGCLTQS
jgi:hypothetical protein